MWRRDRDVYEASGVSIGGDYGGDGWVKRGGVAPLYQFFGRVGLLDSNLCRVKLLGMGEYQPGEGNIFKLSTDFLVHFLDFMDLCLKFRAVVRSCRIFFLTQSNPSRRRSRPKWPPM